MSNILNEVKGIQQIKLLKEGSDPNEIYVKNNVKTTALIEAIKDENINNIKIFLPYINGDFNCSPIKIALIYNNFHIIKLLFEFIKKDNIIVLPFSSYFVESNKTIFKKIITDISPYIFFNDKHSIYTYIIKNNDLNLYNLYKKVNINKFILNGYYNPLYTASLYNINIFTKLSVSHKNFITDEIVTNLLDINIDLAVNILKSNYKYENIIELIKYSNKHEYIDQYILSKINDENRLIIKDFCYKNYNLKLYSKL
jgi:hypothetical protein